MEPLLQVRDLRVNFKTYAGTVHAVRGVDFGVHEGETLAIVGESGCGKSVSALSVMGLVQSPPGVVEGGEIHFDGRNLLQLKNGQMQRLRGSEMSMIFQDPMTSLNPTMTIGNQIAEPLVKHQGMNRRQALQRAREMLELVGIPNADRRLKEFPHEFSGGMRQRAMIAMALACNPKLLIADEPTTALDVTIQAQILELMKRLQAEFNTAIILITHDLGVVAEMADRVAVMYAGEVVETGTVEEIFYNPRHPYTWALMKSIPRLDKSQASLSAIPGTPPDLFAEPKGCPFAPRCEHAMRVCLEQNPVMLETASQTGTDHRAACWLSHPMAPKVEFAAGGGGA